MKKLSLVIIPLLVIVLGLSNHEILERLLSEQALGVVGFLVAIVFVGVVFIAVLMSFDKLFQNGAHDQRRYLDSFSKGVFWILAPAFFVLLFGAIIVGVILVS